MYMFSCDGMTLPEQFQSQPRVFLLQSVRRVFDIASSKFHRKKPSKKEVNCDLTKDEMYIIQYIAGYILQKMKKRCRDTYEFDLICQLIEDEPDDNVSPNSIISVLQNKEFGQLTVPVQGLLNALMVIETKFRSGYQHHHIIENLMQDIDLSTFTLALRNSITNQLLEKIFRYYIRIRCYQKARVINSELQNNKDQNISQRKVLKSICTKK